MMRVSIVAVVASAAIAQAFRDTSPFLMFSSTPLPDTLKDTPTPQLQSSADVLNSAKAILSACDSKNYYIINQAQLTASSISKLFPHLHGALSHESVKSSLQVSEVVGLGEETKQDLISFLENRCGAKVSQRFVEDGRYGPRDTTTVQDEVLIGGLTDSEQQLGQSDHALQMNVLKDIRRFSYTFILFSTPARNIEEHSESPIYEAAFNDPFHMDLKRDLYTRKGNSTKGYDPRPLFEKYQFLTPGLFMGLLVVLILLSILGVGIRAISSLEVSYGAFEKDMGPAAHKKQ